MSDQPADPTIEADRMRRLLADCIDAFARGGAGAAETLLTAEPAVAAEVRARLQKLARAGLLTAPAATAADDEIPERLGEFRLLRRLGAGGMGVVYLAEQESLRRTVALKLVRPEQLFFPGARERFRREVEAIARLSDPGIVPIYMVGEDAGIPFFAMAHIAGCSLADVLARVHDRRPDELTGKDLAAAIAAHIDSAVPEPLPELFAGTWVECVTRIVARMGNAAQHAHERGVLHRDLKPSNAMVTPTGRVLLLDFGLAAAAGTAKITRTGSQLGTLHYMAPEQLRDGAVDARTDVYALAVTLHELLALRAPYHADSAETLRQRILEGLPPPLTAVSVPTDLQTIARCGMDLDPARRYATAAALAKDLERFLARRPIAARPAGPLLRGWRWCQRHPEAATALALVMGAAGGLPPLLAAVRHDADAARAQALESSRTNLRQAVIAIAGMVEQTRLKSLIESPGLDDLRRRQLDSAVTLLRNLRQENPDDHLVLDLFARGMIQSANVRHQFGENEQALRDLAEAEPVLQQTRSARPDDPELMIDDAGLHLARATSLAALGRSAESETIWRALLQAHSDTDMETAPMPLVQALTGCHNNLSRVHHARGELRQAIAALEQSMALDNLMRHRRVGQDGALDAMRTRINHGTLLREQGRLDAAQAAYRAVESALAEGLAAGSTDPDVRQELSRVRFAAAEVAARQNDRSTASSLRAAALALLRALQAEWPDRTAYLLDLAKMEFSASMEAQIEGKIDDAGSLIDEAVKRQRQLVAAQPGNAERRSDLAAFLRQQGAVAGKRGQTDSARALAKQAEELQRAVVLDAPNEPHFLHQLATLQLEVGMYEWNEHHWPQARDAWLAATTSFEAAIAAGDQNSRSPRRLPMALQMLAQAEHMCDDFAGCVRALERLQRVHPMPRGKLLEVARELGCADREDFQALLARAKD
ncbi:MAG: protein kinase [Planctomycetes bacterium]|nr:protein kinase [Planctomycetota bacterium]